MVAVVTATVPSTIGGGRCKRHLTIAGVKYHPGDELDTETIMAMPPTNRRALIEKGSIEVWPLSSAQRRSPTPAERHIVQSGFGRHVKYDVIEGRKLNDNPLTKEEAEALAAEVQQKVA